MGGSTRKGSSTRQQQMQTQNNAPPAWAAPLFTQGASDALALYRAGAGGNVYQGQRVADVGDETRAAIAGLGTNAAAFDNGSLQNLATAPTQAQTNLASMAAGGMIGNNNAFGQALQNTLDNAASSINSRLSGAGRYGSGAHNSILANNLGAIAAAQTAEQYNRDVATMLGANSQIDAANQNQLTAAGNFLGRQGEAYTRALTGAQILDERSQAQLDATRQRWAETDNQGWDRLGLLQAAANGFAGQYGTRSSEAQTQTQKNPGALETIAGIGRLIGKSDRRAKENIIMVGRQNGFALYEFNYKGECTRYRGVMAQDVLARRPDAVFIDPRDGLYCVDYSCLGLRMERI